MNIIVASAFPEKLLPTLRKHDDFYFFTDDSKAPLSVDLIERHNISVGICFGYGKLIPSTLLKRCAFVNLHGGLLPWNRGPNPNLWSWIDGTPKGVTIHVIDSGVDTGGIVAQAPLAMYAETETLQSSFDKTIEALVVLFDENWSQIRSGNYEVDTQTAGGSSHKMADQMPFEASISDNLNRPIPELLEIIRSVYPPVFQNKFLG